MRVHGAVTDGGDWLAAVGKVTHEGDGGFVHAKMVRVHYAAGENEGVVVGGSRVGDHSVDFD